MPYIIATFLVVGFGCLIYGAFHDPNHASQRNDLIYPSNSKPDCYTSDQAMALSGNRTMSFIIASKPRC